MSISFAQIAQTIPIDFPRQLQVSALDWKEPRVSGGSWGYVETRVNLRNVESSWTFVYNSRMRLGVWGLRVCSLDVSQVFATDM